MRLSLTAPRHDADPREVEWITSLLITAIANRPRHVAAIAGWIRHYYPDGARNVNAPR